MEPSDEALLKSLTIRKLKLYFFRKRKVENKFEFRIPKSETMPKNAKTQNENA
jgi:hypothetical protein